MKQLNEIVNKNYRGRIAVIMLLLAAVASFNSCSAPRDNPFDPNNPDYGFVTLKGSVETFSLPYTGIGGVSVYWEPADKLVATDPNGNFSISNILPVNGKLIITKNGFRPDTLDVVWNSAKVLNYQVNLNMIPVLDSISIYTVVINQFSPPGQSYQLIIDAQISDKDNDIDSVYVENQDLSLQKGLDYNITDKSYQTQLSTQDLNISDIEQTIGLNFNIVVKDLYNRQFNIGSERVTRVIKTGVAIQSPANDATVTSQPVLNWQRFKPGYPFTYMVEIYTNDFANSQLVLRQDNISSDSVSYSVPAPLQSRSYYWVIWAVDQFNNRSRSLPATFTVQ